jgi:acyl-CoA thioesterase
MTTKLSQLLAQARLGAGTLQVEVPGDWMQGRSVFGGLQAALALRAMRTLVPETPLRTLQTTFIAPVAGVVSVQARILRTGKNATHVEARIAEGDATQAIVIGVFGTARSSAVSRKLAPRAFAPSQPPLMELPFGAGGGALGGPQFSTHFQVRWHQGEIPFSGGSSTSHVLELAIDDEGPASEAHVLAFADFPPPVALSLLSAPAPGSTLTWMLELLVDRVDHVPTSGVRVEVELIAARDGYTSQALAMFAASGEPIALGHQCMLVFG